MTEFQTILTNRAKRVERHLSLLLDDQPLPNERARPERLMSAIRHSVLNGGKRLRPFLIMETAALFGMPIEDSLPAACAIELIHCYSLVHDDLPAMDDDNMRRGRPTTHKAFDEATAILAGDALLTLCFDVLSRKETSPDPAIRSELVALYARNAGLGGMVGGQMLDLEAETSSLTEDEILTLQAMKTGALLRCACETGAVLANASLEDRERLKYFGSLIGQAFQLADDILDVTSDTETLGKQTGKDAARGKGTLVELLGLDKSRQRAQSLLSEAIDSLQPFGEQAETLRQAARFTLERSY